jgi:hypothetical protein
MKSSIHVDYKLPVNFRPEWAHLFRPDYKYKTVDLKVKELKNVFVNHYGLVIKNGLLVKRCAPNIGFSSYDDSFYFQHWKTATEQMLVCKYGKSLLSLKLDDNKKYLVIHSPWFSYYFWITECLPRLLMVKDRLSELTLLYPVWWKNISFVNQTLELFPELNKIEIPVDQHLFVKDLVMPEVKPWTPMFIPEQMIMVRTLMLHEVEKRGIISPFGDKIYISRKNAARKRFTDEKKVEDVLGNYGFIPVCMEDFKFFEQVAIMKNTKIMTAITGAGHINLLFMKQHGGFLDLTNMDYLTKKQYRFHFYKLCNILQIKYGASLFEHVNDPVVDHYSKQDLITDVDLLNNDIKKIIENVK